MKTYHHEAALVARLQQVHLVIDDLAAVTNQMDSGGDDALSKPSPGIEKLLPEF